MELKLSDAFETKNGEPERDFKLLCEEERKYAREEAVEKLMENCALTREEAQEKAELYWGRTSTHR